ncbi:hypothetical protein CIL05_11605 [Virgibacillus profundi]|uniref:ABC transporter periplasmic binding protein yphF n=1 Tax=Virgibacillus profundi TaxID=2024555 RepID=A0A2A2IE15_9BACI|nr:hypothetical protein [Virgibacillus profundi]PAV29504.1 hypothetical protein CIL05_11605 [Virgibacillus profundi]PXY53674.1 hypothetical protein CIT14_11720 [Virgibacillus profundi]
MKRTYSKVLLAVVLVFILSGCLYPQSKLEKNQQPNESQLELAQNAVNQYKEEKQGLVPIKTKANDTPIFQKYLIDFTALKESNTITEIPGNAYENGGIYQYTLIHPEDNPQVKLIDLRITEEIRKVNVQLDIFRSKHTYPPYGEEVSDGIFTVDYEKLNFDSHPVVKSPYSKENLPIVMDVNGQLYVDYRIDLANALKEYEHEYKEGDDIRYILAENTPFVPAYSLPYTIKDSEPVFFN